MSVTKDEIDYWSSKTSNELFRAVLPFWCQHSEDEELGGFFSCLDADGERYDDRKFMWLNGRQIWMFARICEELRDDELNILSQGTTTRQRLLQMAFRSAEFMSKHGVNENGQVYFSLSRSGEPYHFERKIFSACFLSLGCGVLSSVADLDSNVESSAASSQMKSLGLSLLDSVIRLAHDPTPLGRPSLLGAPPTSPMNVPMIILNLISEYRRSGVLGNSSAMDSSINFDEEERWCVSEILKHVRPERKIVLETVRSDGSILEGSYDGRHMNPGHAIEAGWFLLEYAQRTENSDLKKTASDMIEWSFEAGWDQEHGGLFYFLDSDGRSPPYLEWDMKLWWPHCEAMIAFAMLFEETGDRRHWDRFVQIAEYTFSHFSDASGGGEWFGYCNRAGVLTHKFKGGPYKGCFHVPRALFLVSRLLSRVRSKL